MKKLLKGNQTIAVAVSDAGVKVIPVFPITPQTSIIETLADLIRDKKMNAAYIPMESEHSVMAACIGAATSGVRAFTATSGQGLLYMHELLHWASGARLPLVMGVVNRAVAPGWNIWMDQTDTVSQRDTGWIQMYCSNHQEVYDHLFIAYKLSEKVLIPSMVIQDAFFLSHTIGEVETEDEKKINKFLPSKPNIPFAFDFKNPKTIGSLSDEKNYLEFRYLIEQGFNEARTEILKIYTEFEKIFGRKYSLYESYCADDADYILLLTGTVYETGYKVIDEMRKNGIRIGMVKTRFLRPFFGEELKAIVKNKKKLIVIDRNCSFGKGGVFASEMQSALYGESIEMQQVIAGLGGRDITANTLKHIAQTAIARTDKTIYWEDQIME